MRCGKVSPGSLVVDAPALRVSLLRCSREQEAKARDSMAVSRVEGVRLPGQGRGHVVSRRPFGTQGALAGQPYRLALVLPTPFRNVGVRCRGALAVAFGRRRRIHCTVACSSKAGTRERSCSGACLPWPSVGC